MKQFKFTLQSVHDFREFRREAAERAFAATTAYLNQTKTQLAECKRIFNSSLDRYLLIYQSHEIEASMITAHTDFLGSLLMRERELRQQILELEHEVERKRQALTEAMRETKTTGRLRERHRERYDLEVARKEQSLLDEMAVASHARRRITV